MLPKKNRLVSEKEISKIKKQDGAKGAFFIVNKKNNNLDYGRVVIIVSKKVSLKSTDRNLIKRRISDIFYKNLSKINGIDVSVLALPKSLNTTYQQLEEELNKILFNK